MGVFLQFALFPGCPEADARSAVEKAARNPQFYIDLDKCQYAASYEGTQALIAGELAFDALAKELSRLSQNPVMLLYLCDGDFWGYDFYGGKEEDHFSTMRIHPILQNKFAAMLLQNGRSNIQTHSKM